MVVSTSGFNARIESDLTSILALLTKCLFVRAYIYIIGDDRAAAAVVVVVFVVFLVGSNELIDCYYYCLYCSCYTMSCIYVSGVKL